MKQKWQPSKLERQLQEFSRSEASKQLLRVTWTDFSRAQEKYIRWSAFALWIRAIVNAEQGLPLMVTDALKARCPQFVGKHSSGCEPALLGVRLDEWIHDRMFAKAEREGWLDALFFYGERDPRSKCVRAYWEKCKQEWPGKRPSGYPNFGTWSRSAYSYDLFHVRLKRLVGAIESYVDWLSLVYWLQPLLENKLALPEPIAREVENKAPGFLEVANSAAEACGTTAIETQLISWIEPRYFSEAQKGNWFESVRGHIGTHPRHLKNSEYSRRWRKERPEKRLSAYPSFGQWRDASESFIEVRPR
jgi:hypothetical protein